MVEKVNDIIKNGCIKKNDYENLNQMNENLTRFSTFYNLYRKHGRHRGELKVKTLLNAIEKLVKSKVEPWFEILPCEINLVFTNITLLIEYISRGKLEFFYKNSTILKKSCIFENC